MANLNHHKQTLVLISKATPKAAKKIIAGADGSLIRAISEVCLNILNGVIPLSGPKKRKISKFKKNLRKMVSKASLASKRTTLQEGGFLSMLLSAALPLVIKGISSLAAHIKQKKANKKRRN